MSTVVSRARGLPISFVVEFFVLAGAFAVLIGRTIRYSDPFDLTYILTAGRMWLSGLDPYGSGFAAVGLEAFDKSLQVWAYPPQWWLIATGLGLFSYGNAVVIWKFVNLAALAIGAMLLENAAFRSGSPAPRWAIILFWVGLAAADPTRLTMQLGQTSILMVLGFGLLVHGMVTRESVQKTAGLAILMLKPQFGLFFLVLAVADPAHRRAAFAAVAVTALACLPFLFQRGVFGAFSSLLLLVENVASYGALKWNRPLEINGLSFISGIIGGPKLPDLPLLFAAAFGAWTLQAWLSRDGDHDPRMFWMASLSTFFLVVPLHFYDLILVSSLLLFVHLLKPWAVALLVIANVLAWRSGTWVFNWYGTQLSPWGDIQTASILQSAAGTLIAGMVFVAIVASRKSLPEALRSTAGVQAERDLVRHWTIAIPAELLRRLGLAGSGARSE